METITAVILKGKEDKWILGCLDSLRGKVDEIRVIDSGNDLRWVEGLSDIFIHTFKWTGSFADARNFGIEQCKTDWILMIDDDERLDAGIDLRSQIKRYIKPEIGGMVVRIYGIEPACEYINGELKDYGRRYCDNRLTRFFRRNEKIRYKEGIHELVDGSIEDAGLGIVLSDISIVHLGYDIPLEEYIGKAIRNTERAIEDVRQCESAVSWFNLGYGLVFFDFDLSLQCFFKSLEFSNGGMFRAYAYRYIGYYYKMKGSSERNAEFLQISMDYFEKALDIDPNDKLSYIHGLIVNYELTLDSEVFEEIKKWSSDIKCKWVIKEWLKRINWMYQKK